MSEKVFIFLFYTFNLSHYYEPSLALVICLIIIAQHECEPKIEEAFKNSLSAVISYPHQTCSTKSECCNNFMSCHPLMSYFPFNSKGKIIEIRLK